MKTAWYLGHRADAVGDRALLIGDPDRIDRIAVHLDDVSFLPVKRGLRTVTGRYNRKKVTVAAFGMGAPIATIVLHELADLGVSRFLRIGTAMYFPPMEGGALMISERALSFEGTSRSYSDDPEKCQADDGLIGACREAGAAAGETITGGLFATYDAFYRDMFGIDEAGQARAAQNHRALRDAGVIAIDMETSALIASASALKVGFASLCLGTVNAATLEKLAPDALASGETLLFETALEGITRAG